MSPQKPKPVFRSEDVHTPVEVFEQGDLRSLHLGSAGKQTEMSIREPHKLVEEHLRLMARSLLWQPNPKSILVLGLGGGALPKFFWNAFPECQMDLVERSALVIDVCYRYFALPKVPQLRVHAMDALDFIQSTKVHYDLLFIDLFDGEVPPPFLGETPFFTLCKNRLKDSESVLAWNFSTKTPEQLTSQCLFQLVSAFGPHISVLPAETGGNYVFFAKSAT